MAGYSNGTAQTRNGSKKSACASMAEARHLRAHTNASLKKSHLFAAGNKQERNEGGGSGLNPKRRGNQKIKEKMKGEPWFPLRFVYGHRGI